MLIRIPLGTVLVTRIETLGCSGPVLAWCSQSRQLICLFPRKVIITWEYSFVEVIVGILGGVLGGMFAAPIALPATSLAMKGLETINII